MRPNHQNKRMRGRNRGGGGGGGKGPNPLTRSYESNGPDVKVRGTAQSIAEKYVQLGRDAQASGDHVQAESFFQHAEHYFRLIAAAQEQFRLQNPGYRGFDQQEGGDEEGGDEDQPFGMGQPQPDIQPVFVTNEAGEQVEQQQDYQPREQREFRENRGPRPQRDNRNFQQRDNRNFQPREQREGQGDQPGFEPREDRRDDRRQHQPRDNQRFERGPRRFDRDQQPSMAEGEQPGLPSFITAPSRTPVMPAESEAGIPVEPNLEEPVGIRRRGRPPRVRSEEDTPVGE